MSFFLTLCIAHQMGKSKYLESKVSQKTTMNQLWTVTFILQCFV